MSELSPEEMKILESLIIAAMTSDGEYRIDDVGEHAAEIAKVLVFNGYRPAQLAKPDDTLARFKEALRQSRKGEPLDLEEEEFELFSSIQVSGVVRKHEIESAMRLPDEKLREENKLKIQHLFCQHCRAIQKVMNVEAECWYNPLAVEGDFAFCASNEDSIEHLVPLLPQIRREELETAKKALGELSIKLGDREVDLINAKKEEREKILAVVRDYFYTSFGEFTKKYPNVIKGLTPGSEIFQALEE